MLIRNKNSYDATDEFRLSFFKLLLEFHSAECLALYTKLKTFVFVLYLGDNILIRFTRSIM